MSNDQIRLQGGRCRFDVRECGVVMTPIRKMTVGVSIFLVVCVVAVEGYVLAGWHLDDALYMVVITIFGVGYGEVNPVTSWPLRGLTIAVIVAGYGAVIYTVGGFIQLVIDGELNRAIGARRMKKEIDQLDGHTIICGFGRMGTTLAKELHAAGEPFVAIDTLGGVNPLAEDDGYLVIHGDASEEEVLERAGIRRARVLTTVLSDDATNVFVTLTAREMNPDLTIISRGEHRRTASKLRSCGADTVVMTTNIGAAKISQMILQPAADELLDRFVDTRAGVGIDQMGLELDEIVVDDTSGLANQTLGDIEVRGAHGYLVVGVRSADGTSVIHPPSSHRVSAGDTLVILGFHDDIPEVSPRAAARQLHPELRT